MIESFADPAVVQHGTDAATAVGTSLGTSGVMAAFGWLFLRGKFDSLGLLWKKIDELRERVTADRLADAKEYATRAELTRVVEKLEVHFDKRFDTLESKLDALTRER